jgi:signal transducing adaptor molecule
LTDAVNNVESSQYPPSSPSPNFQRPGPAGTPAPFYVAGAEVPSQANQPPAQQQPPQQQQQQQPPQQQQYAQRPPEQQQQPYGQRPEQRRPSGGKLPAPLQTSTSPTGTRPPAQYNAYQGPPAGARPQSTYGSGPQELSTSVYDSPVAPHNSNPAGAYSGASYPPPEEDPYHAASPNAGRSSNAPNAPSIPPPSVPGASAPSAPGTGYGGYAPYQNPSAPQPSQPYGGYDGYGNSDGRPPPLPLGQAPPVPHGQGRPDAPLSPPPLQPSGAAYDARQTLPSRLSTDGRPQYKAYVPPGSGPGPSAPDGPSAPTDYYGVVAR